MIKNKNKRNYLLIGVLVLFLSITGVTYSYYTAMSSNNTITGNMANTKLELDVKKMTKADETQGGIIPMSNNMVEVAISNNCIDSNGNAVCQIYKTTIKNTGSTNLFLDGYVTLTGGAGIPVGYTPKSNSTTMRWAQVFCDEENNNVSNCTTVGTTTTGATGIDAFTTLDNQTDKTGLNQDNIKTAYEDVIGSGTIKNNSYDIISKNYIRVSDHDISNDTYDRKSDVTSALVYNQYLDTTNTTSTYYFVVWLGENGKDQTQVITEDFFGGIVTFVSSGGNITGTFGSFKENEINEVATTYIKSLYNDGSELNTVHIGGDEANPTISLNATNSIMLDNNGDYRYYGANPNNYVEFNGEKWRIISVGNVKKNEDDTEGEERIKIIRDESIGNYSWDSSENTVNLGYGVNNWPTADLNTLLNDYYYNGLDNQTCYNGRNNASTTCNFSSIGLNDEAKGMIDDALWYLGGNTTPSILTNAMYDAERGETTYNCSTGEGCPRDKKWTWLIGVMYPSDYGYATDLSKCTQALYDYGNTNCKSNDWLFNSAIQWTLAPYSGNAYSVRCVYSSGYVNNGNYAYDAYGVRPTLYLKSNVEIMSGEGTKEKPYTIQAS